MWPDLAVMCAANQIIVLGTFDESGALAVSFSPGDRVSVRGFATPMTVESVSGDDVTVLEFDPRRRTMRKATYKAAVLQPTPQRRAIRAAFL
jgi:hypothetical protein